MKIKYHVANDWTDEQIKIMNKFDLYPLKGHTALQIEEDTYAKVKDYILKWRGSDGIRYPEFTRVELSEAALSAKNGGNEFGYPMPDLDFGYKKLTYDLEGYCEICGIGLVQKDSFRIKSAPPIGKKRLFSLGWVFDELFVDKDLYHNVFEPIGINYREVLKYKSESVLGNVVQLVLPETSEKLNIDNWPFEICSKCGRKKYNAMPQDFFPIYNEIVAPIFKSIEYFGSGASGFKRIFLTKELREKLIKLKIEKLIWYVPAK